MLTPKFLIESNLTHFFPTPGKYTALEGFDTFVFIIIFLFRFFVTLLTAQAAGLQINSTPNILIKP